MSEVVIGRCELRIRRISGWSWGTSPQALLAAATRTLPEIIGSRLGPIAERVAGTVDVVQPVTVRIKATPRQLAALASGETSGAAMELREQIAARVTRAIDDAVAEQASAPAEPLADAQRARGDEAPATTSARASDIAHTALTDARRTLARWAASGALGDVLSRLDHAALVALERAALPDLASAPAISDELRAVVEQALHRIVLGETPVERQRARVALLAAVIVRLPEVATTALLAALDLVAPALEHSSEVQRVARGDEPARSAAGAATSFEIRTVLPFLALAPLHHAGWLASVALLDRHGDAFALAAGLAAKLLAPLERGWARARGDDLVISAFAGAGESIDPPRLTSAARRLEPILGSLDASLRAVITRARGGAPVVLCRDAEIWRLVDADGTVVLALGPQLGEVIAHVPAGTYVLVPAHHVDATVLDQLDYRNQRFISDVAPARGQVWRTFQGISGRMVTNDTATPAAKLVAIAARFTDQILLAEELAGFFAERPAIPRAPVGPFDATCELAASAALADLAARLFPAEPTTPALVVQRFATLDAWVEIAADQVRVRFPSGRRHADLMRAGALGAIAVPWFAGTYELGGS